MKIAILGYGKMGKTIEPLALQNGHEIILKIDADNREQLTLENLRKADVAIEFTQPSAVVDNLLLCFQAGVPVVSGTTGWMERWSEVTAACSEAGGALFHASNFSIGVNIFMAVSRYLAKLMNDQPQYNVAMEEIHHTEKLDAPSGTAITLAEDILENIKRKTDWVNEDSELSNVLPIISKRIENVAGTHQITYSSEADTIEIIHKAHSRQGFAKGALVAAEWMVGKKGIFGMSDLLG